MNDLLQTLEPCLNPWGYVAAGIVGVLIVLLIARRLLRRKKQDERHTLLPKKIDVTSLFPEPPPPGPPTVEFFNIPVRIMAIVLAPVGRVRKLPSALEGYRWLDAVVPGLDRVAVLHEPIIERWPPQVSARGFAHTFFMQLPLPGDTGKGTPWSSTAGIFKLDGQPLMIGLVFYAERPNSFGQMPIDSAEKWLGCLRVRHTG